MLGRKFDQLVLVCPLAAGLVGTDFLERTDAEISFECGMMALAANGEAPSVNSVSHAKGIAFYVFTEGKAGRSPRGRRICILTSNPQMNPASKRLLGAFGHGS